MNGIDWPSVHRRLARLAEDPVCRALAGEGPLFEAMLAERALNLAQEEDRGAGGTAREVLVMEGGRDHWAMELDSLDRVEPLVPPVWVPGQPAAVLGLALMAGERRLVVDLEALVTGAPPRPADRPGHAIGLRGSMVALAVERADGIACLDVPPNAGSADLVWAVLPGGLVLLDSRALVLRVLGGGR